MQRSQIARSHFGLLLFPHFAPYRSKRKYCKGNEMTKSTNTKSEVTLTQTQIDIITKAADQLISGEESKTEARQLMATAEKGQLANLKDTLSDFPGVVTEAIWDSFLKVDVAERLKNSPSKDTLVNRLKRATMGLTLAKDDPSFAPQSEHTNLKKYAEWVGVELQKSVDPATGQPRLKSIAKSAGTKTAKLAAGQTYWLIGKTDAKVKATVIGDHTDLDALKAKAKRHNSEFSQFWFIIAPEPQPLDIASEVEADEFHQNTAVFADSVSFESA